MNALPEKQNEVMQALLSMVESAGKEKGCLSHQVFRDIEDENVFSLINEWETREDLDHYIEAAKFGVMLGIKSLLCEPLDIQIYTISNSEGMAAVNAARNKKN